MSKYYQGAITSSSWAFLIRSPILSFGLPLALQLGCADSPTIPRDTDSPLLTFVFPSANSYDRDGDALVDIEIQLADTGSGIDLGQLRVLSSRLLGPTGSGGGDVLAAFRIVARDSTRVVLEETTDHLLPDGPIQIVARVQDRDGNPAQSTTSFVLPAGALHARLPLPPSPTDPLNVEIVAEDSIGFLLPDLGDLVIPFDPYRLTVMSPLSTGGPLDLFDGEYDPVSQRLFLISSAFSLLAVVDPATLHAEAPIPIAARGVFVTRAPSGLLYLALSNAPNAAIAVVDPIARRQVRLIETSVTDPGNPGSEAFIGAVRFPNGESQLHVPLHVGTGGVLVVDNLTGEVLRSIDIGPDPDHLGNAQHSALDATRGLMYYSDLDGLSAIDIATEAIVGRIDVRDVIPGVEPETVITRFMSLSPSSDRLFVTVAGSIDRPFESWLVDLTTFTVAERFLTGSILENGSAFRPDGQLVFVASGDAIAVYLNRE